jgi:hypothetical protein
MTATKRGRSSSEIIKQFNSLNAKILAILLVGCLLGYHGVLKFINGNFYRVIMHDFSFSLLMSFPLLNHFFLSFFSG